MSDTDSYQPRRAAQYWDHIGAFVRSAVTDAAPLTVYSERELLAAATPLTMWAWQSAGLPLELDVIFALHTIEWFIAVGLPHYCSDSGRNTLRSRLLRMSKALGVLPSAPPRLRPLGGSDPSLPYSAREVTALKSWAYAQATPRRTVNAEALLALGLGAGLAGREIINLTMGDIHADEDGVIVTVRGDRPRTVPVLREWELALRDMTVFAADGEAVFRDGRETANHNLITDFISRSEGKIHLQTRRMRATWLVQHLNAGTPLIPLMMAAGLKSTEALDRFLKFAREPDRLSYRTVLRDASAEPR